MPGHNPDIISKYMDAMQVEINPSQNYKTLTLLIIANLARFNKDKSFTKMKRNDIIDFLNSIRKTEERDPMHKWIGTYNSYLTCVTRFFKWLYSPNESPKVRTKPRVVENIPQLKRKEVSIYKPSDLWTAEDDQLFLKYCPSKRDRCYHAVSRDLSARPSEILSLYVKDIIFKQAGTKQYAEVLVNGKTGTRHLPLIDSLPYVKEWLDAHPQRNNPNAFLICSNDRRFAQRRPVSERGLHKIYRRYKLVYFPNLLKYSKVASTDKQRLTDLLQKPWNPYIRRHSALTEKSKFLRESTLRQHAGWSGRSQMHQKYVHYFGNESNNSILQEYGILPKDNEEMDVLKSKPCPNCDEPNKPDSKFCAKCRMVLTYDAYNESAEEYVRKENELQSVKERMEHIEKILVAVQPILQKIKPEMLGKIELVEKAD